MVPKPIRYVAVIVIVLAFIPPAIIARMRAVPSEQPRIHYVQDMDNQHRLKAQQASPQFDGVPLFADGRAMRPAVAGTVARGELRDDDHLYRGLSGGDWATTFPSQITVDRPLLERGRERFNIFCSPCHGFAGYGDGTVHKRAEQLLISPEGNGTVWVAPKSLHEPTIVEYPIGRIFNTITNGVRTMAGYESQIRVEDRWAIVAYVEALQRSQRARPTDVPGAASLPPVEIIVPDEEAPK